MEAIKERRAIVLQDTIEYYSQDPEGRRCTYDGSCCYSPETIGKEDTSDGCAVGRLLSPKLREELDRDFDGEGIIDPLFQTLPKEIQKLGQDFLANLQRLHDFDKYWDSEGLTEKGKEYVKQIEEVYCI